jgi:hypothetical protein
MPDSLKTPIHALDLSTYVVVVDDAVQTLRGIVGLLGIRSHGRDLATDHCSKYNGVQSLEQAGSGRSDGPKKIKVYIPT